MITLLALLLANPAAASWIPSTEAAIQAFRADYKTDTGRELNKETLGFRLEKHEDETLVRVYFQNGEMLDANDYGCHLHSANEFDCHKEDRASLGAYKRSSKLYTIQNLSESLGLAIELFVQKVATESSIQKIKLWEAEQNIRVVLSYDKAGKTANEFIACHFHGAHMDCHRKRDAGPGEPDKE